MAEENDQRSPIQQAIDETMADPELGPEMMELLKKKKPSLNIPLVDLRRGIQKVKDDATKEIGVVTERLQQTESQLALERKRSELKKTYGFTDDDIAKIDERITKGELPASYDHAAKTVSLERQAAEPTPSIANRGQRPKTFSVSEDAMKSQGALVQDARDKARQFLDERNGRRTG